MKRFGYTLAEVLVALSIVGILTAVTLPLANKFKPDSNKALFLNTYDSLVQILNEVTSNQNLYPLIIPDQYNCTNGPLYNGALAQNSDNEPLEEYGIGAPKFCNILASFYTNEEIPINSCNKAGIANPFDVFDINFTNSQGVQFSIYHTSLLAQKQFDTQISIDVNGDKLPNCRYNANTCRRPDRFTFHIAANGHVVPADEMGQAYLATRENLRYTNYDMAQYNFIENLTVYQEGAYSAETLGPVDLNQQ